MGNHDLSDYLRWITWALCAHGVPSRPPADVETEEEMWKKEEHSQ